MKYIIIVGDEIVDNSNDIGIAMRKSEKYKVKNPRPSQVVDIYQKVDIKSLEK